MNENEELDLSVKLLLNIPIRIDNVGELKQLSLNQVIKLSFQKYYSFLHWICINSEDIMDLLDTFEEIEPFKLIYSECYHNEDFRNLILEGLSSLFDANVLVGDNCFYVGDEGILYQDNFNMVVNIIKSQNCIEKKQKKVLNDKQKEFYKQLQEKRNKYKEHFKDKDSDFSDIISSVCSKHPSINLFNIGELTVYQIINQFKRLNMIEDYSISIKSLLVGADKNDIKLKHWSLKITD